MTNGATNPHFTAWVEHFEANVAVQVAMERDVDWDAPCSLPDPVRRAFVRSFQRFELGENGDGERLLAHAKAAGDPVYHRALSLLVAEEQRHSALFRRGLEHLGAPVMRSHWSDAAFTVLRRSFGLRTELALFLVAESVAMGWFTALATAAPDAVLRGIGRRIAHDERHHLRFQVDRLRVGFVGTPAVLRALVGFGWSIVAIGAVTVLVVDHGDALRACGLSPARYWWRALGTFGRTAFDALGRTRRGVEGPLP
ncbi:ferritin-like domain-containing protein [Myceligenerans pegani]|uniref:Ferritin-like domain-containing protein n=1 Tax=Myceligenerans pegani TaxID=2776917 RepID=A0ABR9N125_9MICO|nr:ferritin-like domain-containing protein [Myceligenerans sp. TRM 65318]MBE1876773.1 ferritin-like domain-containing protein [Myceligenerans sp. TRM 65318]MBE3019044.1 ferritin-like domain-containing protein [Myceligenerans sp. TRM 65318]